MVKGGQEHGPIAGEGGREGDLGDFQVSQALGGRMPGVAIVRRAVYASPEAEIPQTGQQGAVLFVLGRDGQAAHRPTRQAGSQQLPALTTVI